MKGKYIKIALLICIFIGAAFIYAYGVSKAHGEENKFPFTDTSFQAQDDSCNGICESQYQACVSNNQKHCSELLSQCLSNCY